MAPREKHPGVVFVMIGPGGAGKNAIMKAIMAAFPAVRQLATATTRAMRADERQGREHLFVSETRFREMIQNDELLEHQEVTPGKYYGIPRRTVDESLAVGAALIADIEVLGAIQLAAAYPHNVVQIFIAVPGGDIAEQLSVLSERMRGRADEATDIDQRLERARTLELPYQRRCDHIVVNDDLERAIRNTSIIVRQELKQRRRQGELP